MRAFPYGASFSTHTQLNAWFSAGFFTATSSVPSMRVRLLPFVRVGLVRAGPLFLFGVALPRLVGLPVRSPVALLTRVVLGSFLAHAATSLGGIGVNPAKGSCCAAPGPVAGRQRGFPQTSGQPEEVSFSQRLRLNSEAWNRAKAWSCRDETR